MYEEFEKLVNDGNLKISGEHSSSIMRRIEYHKDDFLEEVKRELRWAMPGPGKVPMIRRSHCSKCGQDINYFLEEDTLVPHTADCFNQEEVVVDIPVPTGELLFADRLENAKEVTGHLDKEVDSVNSIKGIVQMVNTYAKEGIGHFAVGNTSPSIFLKNKLILIGNDSYDEDGEEVPLDEEAEKVGWVCTDLWWVTVCDRAIYEKIAQNKFGEEKGSEMAREAAKNADTVLRVEPGIYRIRYFSEPSDEHQLFATIEKIA